MSKLTNNSTDDHNNIQHLPTLAKCAVRLLQVYNTLVCCDGSYFWYGYLTESSVTSESIFKDFVSIIFKHKTLPIRLHEFFVTHVESIIGSINWINTSAQSKEDISGFQREIKRLI